MTADSEGIEPTVAEPLRRNSRPADGGYGRAEQIQEGGFTDGRRERKTQKSKLTFLNIRENLFVKFIYA